MNARRAACMLAAAGILALAGGAVPAFADSGTTTVETSSEAWYNTAEPCDTDGADCSLLPPTSAYADDTLHVAATAGETTAETYVELQTSGIPDGKEITGGTLTLPVNTEPDTGSLRPEEAKLIACPVSEFFDSTEGSFDDPPEHDCESTSSPAKLQAGQQPSFAVDLAIFAAQWADGTTPRLAIAPAPEAKESNETWHVAFWGRKNDADGARPITAELTYGDTSTDSGTGVTDAPEPFTVEPPPQPPPQPPPPVNFDAGGATITEPELVAPAPDPAELPQVEADEPPVAQAAPVANVPRVVRSGFRNKIALAMPLVLLGAAIVTGRSLTKPIQVLQ